MSQNKSKQSKTEEEEVLVKTLQVRVRDKHSKVLSNMARSVNLVWNYINEISYRSIREKGQFKNYNALEKYTTGASKDLGLHSQTVQNVVKEYVTRRVQFKKAKLRWRVSNRSRPNYSLGWIPVNTGQASWKNGQVYHNGHYFRVWDSYGLSQYTFRSASFTEDSRGRWYFNVVVAVDEEKEYEKAKNAQGEVGLDLGLKDIATTSDGDKMLENRFYRDMQQRLAVAQRAGNKKRVKAIHAKIKNRRKDAHHKFTRKLVNQYGVIYAGNVSSSKLAKTKMAKSVYDAGWGKMKTMMEYKCDHAGTVFKEVNEAYTTVTCSSCGSKESRNAPRGRAGLRIREWTCECGVTHDRDINAAKNILAVGHDRLAGGIPVL